MSVGYQVNGQDLANIFAPLHPGWARAPDVGMKSQGTDLAALFAPLSTGSSAPPTGYKASGQDLNTIFAAFGSTGVEVLTQPSAVAGTANAGYPSGPVTSGTTTCAGTKGGGTYTYTWVMVSGNATFTDQNHPTTGVTATVDADSILTGSMYCTITDGVTQVNTNTVSWRLVNNTPGAIGTAVITAGMYDDTEAGIVYYGFGEPGVGEPYGFGTLVSSAIPIGVLAGCFSDTRGGTTLYITAATNPGQGYFATMSTSLGSLSSSSATYTYANGYAIWLWTSALWNDAVIGDNYTIDFIG